MPWSTMEVCHCGQQWIAHKALYVPQLYMRLQFDSVLHRSMIPPVRADPVWGSLQSGPVPPEGRTGPGPRLTVLDWMCLLWTSPNRIIFINFKVDPKNWRSETVFPPTLNQTQRHFITTTRCEQSLWTSVLTRPSESRTGTVPSSWGRRVMDGEDDRGQSVAVPGRYLPISMDFSQGIYNWYKLATNMKTVKEDPVHHSPLLAH